MLRSLYLPRPSLDRELEMEDEPLSLPGYKRASPHSSFPPSSVHSFPSLPFLRLSPLFFLSRSVFRRVLKISSSFRDFPPPPPPPARSKVKSLLPSSSNVFTRLSRVRDVAAPSILPFC
ncbi:hypothetical protein BT93_F2681 [Corymbia citriodora subsp. variegata]|nr:hypothetical protein BT93_F2681 [Corymbia citriodora subsp. variegata]